MPASTAQQRLFLSTLPAGRGERRIALAVALVSLAIFVATAPFAKIQLPRLDAFIPIYESALIINDLVTAVLLFGQFTILRSRAMLVLACGYLFAGLMVAAHMLSFPGLFAEGGLLGAGPQTTAWLYMFWHGGFPLLVAVYALLPQPAADQAPPLRPRMPILVGAGTAILAVCTLVALATAGQSLLPPIMAGNRYTPAMIGVVGGTWLLSLLALGILARRRPYTVLDLWLMVVMSAWLCDIALSAVLNAGRFELGFYAGRIYGFAATSFVLAVLLLETRALYARLARSLEAERVMLQNANEALEQRVRERTLAPRGDRRRDLAGDFVGLSIRDTGIGIAPDDIKRVFEPFFTTKEIGKGTGLGLSQVYGFAQQSGGDVTIDSKLGEGTVVTLYLPRAAGAAAIMSAAGHETTPPASGVVLLVEDDEHVAGMAQEMLGMIGYRAEHARDGGTALALLLSGRKFDAVFSDIIMPGGMSGLDLAHKIRQHFPRMPVLLSTGYARAAGEVHGEGFSIIAKPYRADSLAAALHRAIAAVKQTAAQARDRA